MVCSHANSADVRELLEQRITADIISAFANIPEPDLDIALNLPPESILARGCETQPTLSWRGQISPGMNTVRIHCDTPFWQSFSQVSIKVYRDVVVSTEPLQRGDELNRSSLRLQRMEISQLRMGYFVDINQLTGYQVQRTLQPDRPLTPYNVKAPEVVRRGDWVTILSQRGGLTVTSQGKALRSGHVGEQIPVKNLASDVELRAWILQRGWVSTSSNIDSLTLQELIQK